MRVDLFKFPARGAERRGGRGTMVRPVDDGVFGARRARGFRLRTDNSVSARGAAGSLSAADTEYAAADQLGHHPGRGGHADQSLHGVGRGRAV